MGIIDILGGLGTVPLIDACNVMPESAKQMTAEPHLAPLALFLPERAEWILRPFQNSHRAVGQIRRADGEGDFILSRMEVGSMAQCSVASSSGKMGGPSSDMSHKKLIPW